MKFVATLLFVSLSLLFSVYTTISEPVLLIETEAEIGGVSSASVPPVSYPLLCDQSGEYTIQVVWAYTGTATIPVDVAGMLTPVLEKVNGLFFRDSDDIRVAKVPRWRVDENCKLSVMILPYGVFPTLDEKTKYLLVEPATDYCGKANIWPDDSPTDNKNNGSSLLWVARGCYNYYIVAHEFLHSIGVLALSAPHSNARFHAIDYGDVMSSPIMLVCDSHDSIDCKHDDYFSAHPQPGSYLDLHWNTWNSPYLMTVTKYIQILPLMAVEGAFDDTSTGNH